VLVDAQPMPEPTKGSISGVTWFDDNGDSMFDSAESIITGTPVTLNFNGNVLEQTETDADGSYYFGNLDVDACYTIAFGVADSTVEIGASGGDNDAGANGITQDICLTELTADVADIDAAFVAVPPPEPPADLAICGVAWLDGNGNGMFDSGDITLPNVKVRLIEVGNGQVDMSSTNDQGNYVFSDLTQGEYAVKFLTPDGHEPTVKASSAQAGKSYIWPTGRSPNIILSANNAPADTACSIQHVNGGFIKLPVALEPTVANDDEITQQVGTDFSIAVLGNDEACDGVHEVNLLGHNVPGNVFFNQETQSFQVSSTSSAGTYSLEYGLRGVCGSYDTATVTIVLEEVPVVIPPNAPDAPICRVETGGSTSIGGIDIFNAAQDGFSSEYNMYDRHKNLVVTVSSDNYSHRYLVGQNASQWTIPYLGKWEMEWTGTHYGYNHLSVYFVSALENGQESALTECVRDRISPIALDLENKGRIQRVQGNFEVDLNNDGIKESLSQWFAPSAGILVTGDAKGQISGQQLFGNIPGKYSDGFDELSTLDGNRDGELKNSELYGLAIWNDLNSNTMVDEGELSSLQDHQIISLALNHYKFMSRAAKTNGKSILMEDVWLPYAPMAALIK